MNIQLDEAKRTLGGLEEKIEDLGHALRIGDLNRQIEELDQKTALPDFWSTEGSAAILQKLKGLKDTVGEYEALVQKLEDTQVLREMAQ